MRGFQPVRIMPVAALFAIVITATPAAKAGEYTYTIIADSSGPLSSFSSATVNDAGVVAFVARFDAGGDGICAGSGAEVTTLIDRNGPGGPYTAFQNTCIINNSGAVAFWAGRGSLGEVVSVLEGGSVKVVANRDFYGSLGSVKLVDFNNLGNVGYAATINFGTGASRNLYIDAAPIVPDSGKYQVLSGPALNHRGGHTYAGLTNAVLGNPADSLLFGNGLLMSASTSDVFNFWNPSVNSEGTVFVPVTLDDFKSKRIIRVDGSPKTVVETGGAFSDLGFFVAANDVSQVVFHATLTAGGTGLFTGPDPVKDKVIQTGDLFMGSKVTSVAMERRCLNDEGQVAFIARLEDGRSAVVRADPAPEADIDGDGLPDDWEKKGGGIDVNGDGVIDVSLWEMGADPEHKDLFLELDFVQGQSMTQAAVEELVWAFTTSPNRNPNGRRGIRLHLDLTETNLASPAVTPITDRWPTDYYALRQVHFGTPEIRADPNAENILAARRKFVRYGIVYNLTQGGGIAGRAENPGNDLFLCFGVPYLNDGDDDDVDQAALVMHEFGHNLGLSHGGADKINGKPNYVSVMNYVWSEIDLWNRAFWMLDYSRAALDPLIENNLNESLGLPSAGYYDTVSMIFGVDGTCDGVPCRTPEFVFLDGRPTNWNNKNGDTEIGVTQDVNYMGPGAPFPELRNPSPGQTLNGYNDWANLLFAFDVTGDFADRPSGELPEDEPSQEMHDWKKANIPIPPTPCPDLPDRHRFLTVDSGKPAEFTVTVRGEGPFTYRWRKDGQALSDGAGISGSGTASLTLSSVQTSDAGRYNVAVTAACGTRLTNVTELEVTIPYTVEEAVQTLRIASGLLSATPDQMTRLDVYQVKPSRDVIDMTDVARVLSRALDR